MDGSSQGNLRILVLCLEVKLSAYKRSRKGLAVAGVRQASLSSWICGPRTYPAGSLTNLSFKVSAGLDILT